MNNNDNANAKQNTNPPLNPIILASASPRRKELLSAIGLVFDVIPSDIDETQVTDSDPCNYVKLLSELKASHVARMYPEHWVIGADTIVLIDGQILGKPESIDHARMMLRCLSGRCHTVLTGYCLTCKQKSVLYSDVVQTRVLFKTLSEKEIDWYIVSGEPFDKAGAYGIQAKGMFMIKEIYGSYTNVVGLPVCDILSMLIQYNIVDMDTYAISAN
ncbi:MAG: septum formation inhibitor Maf [Desulfobacterales bacterium]|nr:septum formation inhibitor Maf [Desulfobacterales bacterium]